MITKEQAIINVEKYVSNRNRNYIKIEKERVNYEEQRKIPYGKYENTLKNIFIVTCYEEGYTEPIPHFVVVDSETGNILFTMTNHGYAEDWEE